MTPSAEKTSELAFTESQKQALLTLLADDDPKVYESIRDTIIDQGPAAGEWMRQHRLEDDRRLRRRVTEIVSHFDRLATETEFLKFCLNKSDKINVERGAWLLCRTRYPEISVSGYEAILDSYVADLMGRIDFGASPGRILGTINFYLYQYLGFGGDMEDYYDPQNSYLCRVIDRLRGNPISLSAVYLFICRRLHLPVVGIGMPGHFICRFQTPREQIYIDPFQRGKLMTKGDCIKMLIQSGHEYHDGFITPVTPRRMLLRMCSNLQHAYSIREKQSEANRMQHYIVALSR
ncbi:MAG: transglutaminase family protein [Verrucomicrobiae bacterium]|nr:transglutaminase family protein [Verrucomicrobiae bacterium]